MGHERNSVLRFRGRIRLALLVRRQLKVVYAASTTINIATRSLLLHYSVLDLLCLVINSAAILSTREETNHEVWIGDAS